METESYNTTTSPEKLIIFEIHNSQFFVVLRLRWMSLTIQTKGVTIVQFNEPTASLPPQ